MTQVADVLDMEIALVEEQISKLESYKAALQSAIEARRGLDGLLAGGEGAGTGTSTTRSAPTFGINKAPADSQPNTLEMVRIVLPNLKWGKEDTG